MAMINQTGTLVGSSLSGVGANTAYGQAVFSIGWKYVFAAMDSTQLVGTLMNVDPGTGAPLSVNGAASTKAITSGLPYTNSWNSGNCMCSTTVDGVDYMYIRFTAAGSSPTIVYRGTWDDTNKYFSGFTAFATMTGTVMTGANYNAMARINNTTIRIVAQGGFKYEFDVRTGATITNVVTQTGTWSPSSYPFANAFVPLSNPTYVFGGSGDGLNFYYNDGTTSASFDPSTDTTYYGGTTTVGSAWDIHPSTHFNVSYYLPNTGIIYAYANNGVYIQPLTVTSTAATNIGIYSATMNGTSTMYGTGVIGYFEYGPTTAYGTSVQINNLTSSYSYDLPGVPASTLRNYRAYIMAGATKVNGSNQIFTTKSGLALVTTGAISSITGTTASAAGTVTSFDE